MIIQFNDSRIKVVPCSKGKGKVVLLPGCNEIDDILWSDARECALKHTSKNGKDVCYPDIDSGRIVEIEEKKEIIEEKTLKNGEIKQETKNIVEKEFSKMSTKKKNELIKDTWNINTLNTWLEQEHTHDIRHTIQKKLEEIDKKNISVDLGKPGNSI